MVQGNHKTGVDGAFISPLVEVGVFCDVFDKTKLPKDYYRAMIGLINHIVMTKDAGTILGALEKCGVDEAMLKDLGYEFLIEICDECAANLL